MAIPNPTVPDSTVLARLRRIGPFAALRPDELSALLGQARLTHAAPGAPLAISGRSPNSLYAVLEGSVSLFCTLANGQRCLVEVTDAPCLVGESMLFGGYSSTVEAEVLRPALVIELPATAVLRCLRGNSAAQLRMLSYMSARLKPLIAQITDLKLMTGPQRLARYLVALFDRQNGNSPVHLPFEKRTLAAVLGMSPESLSRAFRRLDALGVDSQAGGGIAIADIDRLRQFVEARSAD